MKRNIFIFNKNRRYLAKYDYYYYIWYSGHRLFFNSLVFRGRKLWAFNFFLKLKTTLKQREKIDPFWLFLISIMKIMPEIILFPKKLGGMIQGVPLPISERKQFTYIIKWTVKLLRDKFRFVTIETLSDILINAIYDKGEAIDKKVLSYKTSTENRHLLRFFKR